MTKQETIKYLTDLVGVVDYAYFKGGLGEMSPLPTGGNGAVCGKLLIHESDDHIGIDLYHFGGDGNPVCEGLKSCTASFDDGTTSTGWLYCMLYYPEDVTPLQFAFDQDNGPDISLDPEDLPNETLTAITMWLKSQLQN